MPRLSGQTIFVCRHSPTNKKFSLCPRRLCGESRLYFGQACAQYKSLLKPAPVLLCCLPFFFKSTESPSVRFKATVASSESDVFPVAYLRIPQRFSCLDKRKDRRDRLFEQDQVESGGPKPQDFGDPFRRRSSGLCGAVVMSRKTWV